jgi:ferrochelatase
MPRAVLLVSHGTVDHLDDLPGFLTNVRRGHPPGPELVAELRRRYEAIGGRSPLHAINAELARKLRAKLGVPVAWASRLWKPYVRDVLARLAGDGAKDVALVPLAQHSAHVYAEDARRAAEDIDVVLACATNWGAAPGLCDAFAERIVRRVSATKDPSSTQVVMTAHSLPRWVIERGDPYENEVRAASDSVAALLRRRLGQDVRHTLAFQSQGIGSRGPDGKLVEWLGPDLRAVIDEAAACGIRRIVFAPIGFLADHVETLYDLDIEARAMTDARGMEYARAASLNSDDDLVDVLDAVTRPLLGHG